MYYKITDKTSEKYKELYTIRKEEIAIEERNQAKIRERFPDWNNNYVGYKGQQNMGRVTTYVGLGFDDKEKVNLKEWKEHKEYKGFYKPNRRTKAGKEVDKFLNELETSSYFKVKYILGYEDLERFRFPYFEIGKDGNLYLYLDDNCATTKEFIEITSVEFKKALELED